MLRFAFAIVACGALLLLGWGRLFSTGSDDTPATPVGVEATGSETSESNVGASKALSTEAGLLFVENAYSLWAGSDLPESLGE